MAEGSFYVPESPLYPVPVYDYDSHSYIQYPNVAMGITEGAETMTMTAPVTTDGYVIRDGDTVKVTYTGTFNGKEGSAKFIDRPGHKSWYERADAVISPVGNAVRAKHRDVWSAGPLKLPYTVLNGVFRYGASPRSWTATEFFAHFKDDVVLVVRNGKPVTESPASGSKGTWYEKGTPVTVSYEAVYRDVHHDGMGSVRYKFDRLDHPGWNEIGTDTIYELVRKAERLVRNNDVWVAEKIPWVYSTELDALYAPGKPTYSALSKSAFFEKYPNARLMIRKGLAVPPG
jgi:hypothetical protein